MNTERDAPYSKTRLKRGLGYFAFGKIASALLGLIIFLLTVRLLSVPEYAAYVSIIAALEIAVAFSTFGLDWIGIRYIPDLRARGGGAVLRGLILRLCLYRAAVLVALVAAGWLLLGFLLRGTPLAPYEQVARLYLLVLFCEGMLRYVIGSVFDPLLMQAQSQLTAIGRNGVFAASLALAGGGAGLAQVAYWELAASATGLAASLVLLLAHLPRLGGDERQGQGADVALPTPAQMRSMAWHNYASLVIALPYSPYTLVLIASHFLPPAGTALLGFARNLSDLIRRYQPVELLLGLVRPMLIAAYARERDFDRLQRLSHLVYKLSLITLCPVMVAFAVYGDVLVGLASSGKYPDARWLVAGLACVMALRSNRVLMNTMANILDQPQLLTRTALATLIVVPLSVAGFAAGQGAWTMLGAAFLEELLGGWIVAHGLRALGFPYALPWAAMLRVAAVVAGLSALLLWARQAGLPGDWPLVQAALAGALSAGLVLVIGYFGPVERGTLRGIAGPRAAGGDAPGEAATH